MSERIRGFEVISENGLKKANQLICEYSELLNRIKMPRRGTIDSAGYDIFNNTGSEIVVKTGELSPAYPTFIKSYMQIDEYLAIHMRSGHGFKYSVRLANVTGVIDAMYYNNINNEGHIFVKFHNQGPKDWIIPAGEAFCQGIFSKYLITDNDSETVGGKRIGGFGSTT